MSETRPSQISRLPEPQSLPSPTRSPASGKTSPPSRLSGPSKLAASLTLCLMLLCHLYSVSCSGSPLILVQACQSLPPPRPIPVNGFTANCPQGAFCVDPENQRKLVQNLLSQEQWMMDTWIRCGAPADAGVTPPE